MEKARGSFEFGTQNFLSKRSRLAFVRRSPMAHMMGFRVVTAPNAARTPLPRRAFRRHAPLCSRPSTVVSAASSAPVASQEPLTQLSGVELRRASDGQTVDAASIVPSSGRVVVPFLTQFADFDSWELAQKIVDDIDALDAKGVALAAVGIGSLEAAKEFCRRTNFPLDRLYVDETAAAYKALDFAPGFGRAGGELGWIGEKLPFVNGYVKLLVMCAGIGSPGTLASVFGGYLGSKDKDPIFREGSNYDNPKIRKLMDATLGGGYQRPFELATLRLTNMTEILSNWEHLAPADDNLLVQRGGSLVFEDGVCVFRHDDAGILGYCPVERLVAKALSDDPAAPPDPVATLHAAAADRSAYVDDIYASIVALEKAKKADRRVSGDELNGKWRLVYTSGTKKVAANLNRAGFGGSYFPVRAVQSFDVGAGRIRNGIYLGPLKFFFDGPFVWRERLSMLEFTFTKVSLAVGPFGPVSFDIDDGKWDAVKMAEQSASDGQGKVEKGNGSKPGANPFFKFVHTDEKCIAARGRGGGLALWSKEGPPETDASQADGNRF